MGVMGPREESKGSGEMSGLPEALFFPYIDLEGRTLWSLLVWFRRILLLQPRFCCLGSCALEARASGWLEVERPLWVDLDSTAARSLLSEWERLAHLYQDSGYLFYLQHGLPHLQEEPGWNLVREIRRYGGDHQEISAEENTLRGQLLLQMAQDLDRQRREIQEELASLERNEAQMLRQLGVGEVDDLEWATEPLPSLEEDDFLIPLRVRAWGELLTARRTSTTPPLLTTNRLALEHLLDRALAPQPLEEWAIPISLMEVPLPLFRPADGKECGRIREALVDLTPWNTFCENFSSLLGEAKGTSHEQTQALLPRARALGSYFREQVSELVIERIVAMEPRWTMGWQEASLQLLLLPGWDARVILGDSPNPDKGNLVVMHLEEA